MQKFQNLLAACENNDIDAVKDLIGQGVSVNGQMPGANSPLILAVESDLLDITRLLAEAGAEIDYENDAGDTALNCAVSNDSYEIVLYLLDLGANFDSKNRFEVSARDYLSTDKSNRIVRLVNAERDKT